MFNKINVLIVCMANFCRSPVAEAILANSTNENVIIKSAGILNLKKNHMDHRSANFLEGLGLSNSHQTTRIDEKILKKSSLIYTFDNKLVEKLRASHPLHHSKIKLIYEQEITDPINYLPEKYEENMQTILKASKKLADKLNSMF